MPVAMLGDLGDKMLAKGYKILHHIIAYLFELRIRIEVSPVKLLQVLNQLFVGILRSSAALIKFCLHAVDCIIKILLFLSPISGKTIIVGYSIYLGFQAMMPCSLTLKMAADLT